MAIRDQWSGRSGFILATIGSAVGIGSIWKFPYEVGSNGGSMFIVCYLVGLVLIVTPLMLVEFAIGRIGRSDAAESIASIAMAARRSPHWRRLGELGILTGILILSFYSVIGGWTIGYAVDAVTGALSAADPAVAKGLFDALLSSPWRMLLLHFAFMSVVATVVAGGISSGIEAVCRVTMPALIVLVTFLAGYALVVGDAAQALQFMFRIDLARLTTRTVLDALGLGFFSIGVGLGLMITYAAYSGDRIDLKQAAWLTIASDTAISFLAGLAIFPLVFAYRLDPASGPGLIFITLPIAFARMPLGSAVAVAFYTLMFLAALSSAIAMLELAVAWLIRTTGSSRTVATIVASVVCWTLGIATVLSFNVWSTWHPITIVPGLAGLTVFGLVDYLTSDILLPVAGLCLAIFSGWVMSADSLAQQLGFSPRSIGIIHVGLRYVVPILIVIVTVAPLWN